jgi:hypothetical protein
MNFLFSVYILLLISSTALLKVILSMPQSRQRYSPRQVALLLELYSKASSPNPSPGNITFLLTPLTSTSIFPECRRKKLEALSFWVMMSSPGEI